MSDHPEKALAIDKNGLSKSDQNGDVCGDAEAEFPYHWLALDVERDGFWGKVDHASRRVAEWFNPILVKEARQSLKSRQFIITFFLLLIASCFWTVFGVIVNAPNVYYVPTGDAMIYGYYFVLAIPLIGMVPLAAQRSLAAEIDEQTFEMLVITKLSSMRIVMGKLNSAMLQMLIYFAAIVPCLAFTYLLRGIDLLTITTLIVVIFFTALVVTAAALMMATLTEKRAGQTLALLATIFVVFIAEIWCAAFCLDAILRRGVDSEELVLTGLFVIVGLSCVALFVKVAASRIAPVTENRSTGLRYLMFLQQLIWAGSIGLIFLFLDGDEDLVSIGNLVIGTYWLLMGTCMLAESPELSPRVQRGLPSTFAGRAILTWFNPGPGTGFVYAVATGTAGITVMALLGMTAGGRSSSGQSLLFAMVMVGYLTGYLGIVRLLMIPLSRRLGRAFTLPVSILASVLLLSLLLPSVISVATTGSTGGSYAAIDTFNWAWTISEAMDRRFSPNLAVLILLVGGVIALLNLAFLFREFDYRRIAVPQRVLDDSAVE